MQAKLVTKRFLYTLIIILVFYTQIRAQSESLTLARSIEIALKNNPLLQSPMAAIQSAELSLLATKKGAGYRTDLTLGATSNRADEGRSGSLRLSQTLPWGGTIQLSTNLNQTGFRPYMIGKSSMTDLNYGLSFQQDILTANTQKLYEKSSVLNLMRQKRTFDNIKRNLIYSVTEAFYDVVQAQKIVEVRAQAVELARILVDLVRKGFEEGVSVDVDLLESQVLLSLAEVNLEQAKLQLETVKTDFLDLLCKPLDQEFSLSYDLAVQVIALPAEHLIDLAIKNHPDIENLELQMKQSELSIEFMKKRFDFYLSLFGNYQSNALGWSLRSTVGQLHNDWSIGVSINLPLWDSHITDYNIESMKLQIVDTKFNRESRIKQLRLRIENERRNLDMLLKTIRLLEKEVDYSQKNLELTDMKFRMGLNRAEDVIRAQQNLTNASLTLVNEMIKYKISVARLYFYTGLDAFAPEGFVNDIFVK